MKNYKIYQKNFNKITVPTCVSITILNGNGLSASNKRHVSEWQKEKKGCLQETNFRLEQNTNRLKVKEWKKILLTSGNKKK